MLGIFEIWEGAKPLAWVRTWSIYNRTPSFLTSSLYAWMDYLDRRESEKGYATGLPNHPYTPELFGTPLNPAHIWGGYEGVRAVRHVGSSPPQATLYFSLFFLYPLFLSPPIIYMHFVSLLWWTLINKLWRVTLSKKKKSTCDWTI